MSKVLEFKVSGGYPGGFVAEVDGYLCFVNPVVDGGRIVWAWTIQSGGGWGGRGAGPIVKHSTGTALSAQFAEDDIHEELNALAVSSDH
ncbi:MAG: hypothetical protein V4713_03745 [Pseudomonadota bacterium]